MRLRHTLLLCRWKGLWTLKSGLSIRLENGDSFFFFHFSCQPPLFMFKSKLFKFKSSVWHLALPDNPNLVLLRLLLKLCLAGLRSLVRSLPGHPFCSTSSLTASPYCNSITSMLTDISEYCIVFKVPLLTRIYRNISVEK